MDWSQKHEGIFTDIMEEEVFKGNRTTTTFMKSSWQYIIEELCAQAKRNCSDSQQRNKFNYLKQKQNEFKALLKEIDIVYYAVTRQVCVIDEVWDRLTRVKHYLEWSLGLLFKNINFLI